MEQQKNFEIKIDISGILDKFDCPVCMCKYSEPTITKCGHTFCSQCIAECINNKHQCPLCMTDLKTVKDDTIRNFSLETLLKELHSKKEEETKSYFNSLANRAISD